MKRVKYKKRINIKKKRIIFVIILAIVINTISFLMIFITKFSSVIEESAKKELKEITTNIVIKYLTKENLMKVSMEELIVINKDKEDVISHIDFKLDKGYEVILNIKEQIENEVIDLKNGKLHSPAIAINDNLIIKVPYYAWSDNILLMNLGPKIYIKINLLENVRGDLYTKVTGYGINSLLINLYITLYIKESLLYPASSEQIEYKFDMLVASKVIQGKIPEFYNGILESKSSVINLK
ncbi:MAG: sporulation protein YunB [Bacilli bacterium]|nr:sporulation protein YunB [Bacilli bacterium]